MNHGLLLRYVTLPGVYEGLDARGQAFTTFTGLRGVISLVLLQMVVTGAANGGQNERLIVAQMVVWGAGFVSLTLLLNAPFIGAVLSATGLNKVSPTKLAIRSKAWRALQRFSGSAVKDLQEDGDEVRCFLEPQGALLYRASHLGQMHHVPLCAIGRKIGQVC